MKESLGYNLALPSAALLDADTGKLALETSSWIHLNRYLGTIESLPADFESGSSATGEALVKLRSEAAAFGSPKRLRQLVQERPDILSDKQPPSLLYAGIVWEIQRLHESAAAVVSYLQSLTESASSGTNVREGLQLLAGQGEKTRNPIGPLIGDLKTFKEAMLAANGALTKTGKADADALHQMQEDLGGLKVRVETLQERIHRLGFFSSGKKHDLEQQLQTLQSEFRESSARAERLRLSLSRVEPILNEGFWLKSGVDDLVDYLEQLRKAWTAFGSSMAQLAVDASDARLKDSGWLGQTLGLEQAVSGWTAIERAAKQFVVQSLVDFPPGN